MDVRDGDPEAQGLPAVPSPGEGGRIGVLLLNLGTPDGTGYWPMRRYLKEFLSDRRVIEVPRWKWWPILNLIILTVRPGRKGKRLRQDLEQERDEGPLKTITRAQAEKLGRRARRRTASWSIGPCAMPDPDDARAGSRSCSSEGCDRILLVPLYPQYAAATTATACDEAFRALDAPALAAGGAGGAALLRRSRLHRRIGHLDPRPPRRARLRARGADRLLPRHAPALPGERRPLPLPLPEDLTAPAREARLGERALAHHLPVALRQRAVAAALHRSRRSSGWRGPA